MVNTPALLDQLNTGANNLTKVTVAAAVPYTVGINNYIFNRDRELLLAL